RSPRKRAGLNVFRTKYRVEVTLHPTPTLRPAEQSVIRPDLPGVGYGECRDCAIELRRPAHVAGEQRRVTGSRVSLGQNLAAQHGILAERPPVEFCGIERGLVIGQLADEIVMTVESGVSEEWIGQRLHHLLSFS